MFGGSDQYTIGHLVTMPKKVNVLEKKWGNLTQLKSHFDREGGERVVSFDGFELTTGKYKYTLAHGELHREKK